MSTPSISDFSPHLFWDINPKQLDFEKNKAHIIKRVLEYGFIKDWMSISKFYSIPVIAQIATQLRELDPRALSFIATLSGLPKESVRCYTTKPQTTAYWNF